MDNPDFNNFEISEIDIAIPPEEILERFNNELKNSSVSILASVKILSMYPEEQTYQKCLNIISNNVNRIEKIRETVKNYLEKRKQKD